MRFGGVSFGALGAAPGAFPLGDCFCEGEAAVAGFSPGPVGEPPGVGVGFAPIKFAGTDFFPAAAAFGEAPGITFAFGEPAPGFNKLGGDFCPVTAGGEPVAPGDPACPFLPICGFT